MSSRLLEVRDISKSFGIPALSKLRFELYANERVGLIGPNGSGKTTCVNVVSGVLAPDEGTVWFDGREVTRLPPHRRARMGIARTFQIPLPFSSMNLEESLEIPLRFTYYKGLTSEARREKAVQILKTVGLERVASRRPKELTQIDLRKLELARALAQHPKLLLLDEVMAGLSSGEIVELLEVLSGLRAEGVAIMMIEHIMWAVMRFCTRILVLDVGRKIAEGTPEEILADKEVERAYFGN